MSTDAKPAKPNNSAKVPRPGPPKLRPRLEVTTDIGTFLGDTRIRLLEAIDQHGSISQAAKHVPLSYKAAWDAVEAMNNLSEEPLVTRVSGGRHGGGTELTEHGRKVVALFRAVESEYQLALERLTEAWDEVDGGSIRAFQRLLRRMGMRTSARNQLACTVSGMKEGPVNFEVYLRLDGQHELVAVITRESAEQLGLRMGMEVVALIKASSVLLMTDTTLRTSARNHLWGEVDRVVEGAVNSEVTVSLGGGKSVTAVVTAESVRQMGLKEGDRACALFKSSSVILSVLG